MPDKFYFRRRKSDYVAAIHEDETIVVQNAIRIKPWPALQKGLRVGIDRCGQSMRRPAFEKNFATCDARTRFKIQGGTTLSARAPGGRAEFAKGIVLRGDTLEIKEKVTFPFAGPTIARRKLAAGVIDQVMNIARAEDEIARKNPLAGLQQGPARSGQFLFKLMFQLRTCLPGGRRDPRVFLELLRNFLLGNFVATNGDAPRRELFRAKAAITSSDKFQSCIFDLIELVFPRKQMARGGENVWRRQLLKNIKWNAGEPN